MTYHSVIGIMRFIVLNTRQGLYMVKPWTIETIKSTNIIILFFIIGFVRDSDCKYCLYQNIDNGALKYIYFM